MTPPGARPPAASKRGIGSSGARLRRARSSSTQPARCWRTTPRHERASKRSQSPPPWGTGPSTTTSSKAELFEAALTDVVEELRELLDQISIDVDDPALSFAQSLRLTLRLCRRRPQISAVLIRHRMNHIDSQQGHIRAAMACGRFRRAEPRLTRAAVFGAALATLQLALTEPDLVDDAACDQLAEQMLRMLGVPFADARTLAHAPLPPAELPKPG